MNEALQARLAALRAGGAGRRDPLRFRAVEVLARRSEGQPPAVRALLEQKLAARLAEFELAPLPAAKTPAPVASRPQPPAPGPLAALAAQLREATLARLATAADGDAPHEHELASARGFRQAWQARRTVEQVEQALERRPPNAGPLNSHALVLRSLALMRELSPDYLRRFLVQVDALQWLEQAPEATPARPAKAARAPRRRRTGGK